MRSSLLLVAVLVLGCSPQSVATPPQPKPVRPVERPVQPPAADADVTSEHYAAPELPKGTLTLTDAFGGRHRVEVEIASTDAERTRGLMWRKELAEGKGMLFVFAHESRQSFWMRNTLISLDMIFIGADGRIAGIVPRTTPLSLDSRGVERPSKYVLEVPGGWSEKLGLRAGSPVDLSKLPPVDVKG